MMHADDLTGRDLTDRERAARIVGINLDPEHSLTVHGIRLHAWLWFGCWNWRPEPRTLCGRALHYLGRSAVPREAVTCRLCLRVAEREDRRMGRMKRGEDET